MNLTNVTSLIAARIGNRTDLNTTIQLEMQLVQEMLEGDPTTAAMWFLEVDASGLVTVASTETVSLPTDFLLEQEEVELEIQVDGEWESLGAKDHLGTIRDLYRTHESDQPKRFAVVGSKLYFQPIPDDAYTIRWRYFGAAADILSVSENLWLANAADLIIAETSYAMASKHLQNQELATAISTDIKRARDRLLHMDAARRVAGRSMSMGDL